MAGEHGGICSSNPNNVVLRTGSNNGTNQSGKSTVAEQMNALAMSAMRFSRRKVKILTIREKSSFIEGNIGESMVSVADQD